MEPNEAVHQKLQNYKGKDLKQIPKYIKNKLLDKDIKLTIKGDLLKFIYKKLNKLNCKEITVSKELISEYLKSYY